jgi:exoribonuclease-2
MRLNRNPQLGERFTVKVAHVDPRQDIIQFQEITDQATEPAFS